MTYQTSAPVAPRAVASTPQGATARPRLWTPASMQQAKGAPKLGPVRWCRRCSRRHPSRQGCDLASVAVEAKSGRLVERLVHTGARS